MGQFIQAVIVIAIYMIPTIIAALRGHRSVWAIGVVNFAFGWTGIFWIIALIWSLTNNGTATVNVINVVK